MYQVRCAACHVLTPWSDHPPILLHVPHLLLSDAQGSVLTDGSSNGDRDPKDFADALPHVHVVLAFAEAP